MKTDCKLIALRRLCNAFVARMRRLPFRRWRLLAGVGGVSLLLHAGVADLWCGQGGGGRGVPAPGGPISAHLSGPVSAPVVAGAPVTAPARQAMPVRQKGGSARPAVAAASTVAAPAVITSGEADVSGWRPFGLSEAQAAWRLAVLARLHPPPVRLAAPLSVRVLAGEGGGMRVEAVRSTGDEQADRAWLAAVREAVVAVPDVPVGQTLAIDLVVDAE